jgi:ribonuclease HI
MSDIITFFNPKQCNIHTESTIVPDYYVYTDGACSNNGRSNAIAGIGIFFGNNDPRNVSKRIEGKQTNNTAEMLAIIDTYEIIEQDIIGLEMCSKLR